MSLLPVDEALRRVLDGVQPLDSETVPLIAARDRVLAADVDARLTQPPFNVSAMDGYAVRGADIATVPAMLTVIGEANAGGPFGGVVEAGQAVRIFTGGSLPGGTDTVVIQENTTRQNDTLTVMETALPGANIRNAGSDFRADETLLRAGRRLDASAVLLAAAGGHPTLPVQRKPRVAILATGDELVLPGQQPGAGQIVSSNPYGLAAIVEAFGGEAKLLGIARDTMPALAAALVEADDADVLVTIGGASVGDRDLIKPALEARGMALDFWKVAIRPGKPMLFGRHGPHQRVLGLPGNPLSCLITARIFLVPLLFALLGRRDDPLPEHAAVLTAGIAANGPRQHYMRARMTAVPGQLCRVDPLSSQDSAHITALAHANALIIRPSGAAAAAAGDVVRVLAIDF